MRIKYLKILGLEEFATDEAIKKAWKKKALLFHPDKNPSKTAQTDFIKICDAYQKLSSNSFEPLEEILPSSSSAFYRRYNKELTPEEFETKIQKAREHAKYKEVFEENVLAISFSSLKKSFLYKFSNIVGVLSILTGTVLLLDYAVLTPNEEQAVIINYELGLDDIHYKIYDLNEELPTNKREYELSVANNDANFQLLPPNSFITIYKSKILNENISFSDKERNYEKSMHNANSIFIAFWIFIVLFYLPIINFVTHGPNTVYLVFVHVNAYLPIFAFIGLIIGLL